MSTGKAALAQALREPMSVAGWRPRASGWFTCALAPGAVGVVSLTSASKHTEAGTALATVHVGLRVEAVEAEVSRLCGIKDTGYQQRTAVDSIGYLMPERSWREWQVSVGNAQKVAADVAEAVKCHGLPYLTSLVADPVLMAQAVRRSPAWGQAIGWSRLVVLYALAGHLDEAKRVVDEQVEALGDRQDAATLDVREVASRVGGWLVANRV